MRLGDNWNIEQMIVTYSHNQKLAPLVQEIG